MTQSTRVLDEATRQELKKLHKELRASNRYYRVGKRVADILCSLAALVVFVVLFPFIALAIVIDSPGPVFFSQTRVGQFGDPFTIWKLRTMRKDAEDLVDKGAFKDKENPFLQSENDPRVTRVGAFLRKYSIDELPQLFCVFAGKMSFIGPRPFIAPEIRMLKPEHLRRLAIRPGLTGLAQISGRNNLNLEQRMQKDKEYIANMSARLDIRILWDTLIKVITHDGAS